MQKLQTVAEQDKSWEGVNQAGLQLFHVIIV